MRRAKYPIDPDIEERDVSRSRKLQIQYARNGLCRFCGGARAKNLMMCLRHAVQLRDGERKRKGTKRRNYSRTSWLEAKNVVS